MSPELLLIAMGIGAAANAIWFDFRFPSLAPSDLRVGIFHLFAASILIRTAVPAAFDLSHDTPAAALGTIFGIAFPVLTYLLLSGFWLLKVCQGMLAGRLR